MVTSPLDATMFGFPERMILLREQLGGAVKELPVAGTPCNCWGTKVSFIDSSGKPLPRFALRLPCCNQTIILDEFGIKCVMAFFAESTNARLRVLGKSR